MARFSRSSRSRFRRRRSPYDLQRQLFCRNGFTFLAPSTCGIPNSYATMLAGPFGTIVNQNFATIGAMQGAKSYTIGGMHFQLEWSLNPLLFGFEMGGATDIMEIYEAICVLPLGQGSIASPAYVPTWTNTGGGAQVGDVGTRVLWKRINTMPFWGASVQPGIQLQSTMRDQGHGPIQIRSKVRLTEREGLFHCFNFVSGVAVGTGPIVLDGWFNTAIKPNFR